MAYLVITNRFPINSRTVNKDKFKVSCSQKRFKGLFLAWGYKAYARGLAAFGESFFLEFGRLDNRRDIFLMVLFLFYSAKTVLFSVLFLALFD